jgi:NADH dehydrogenase (ubiquinone) 1 alpha subcomplex subunit 12
MHIFVGGEWGCWNKEIEGCDHSIWTSKLVGLYGYLLLFFFSSVLQLLAQKTARYLVEHKQNYSGEGEELIYHSKGHALNPGQRDWTRYQPWEPKKE